jgi:rRNA maturation endonuclease Nob1
VLGRALSVEGRVPIRQRVQCPGCAAELVRKPGGRCPACGTAVAEHVQAARDREERIERVVAVVGTVLVVAVLAFTAGIGLVEGALAYAGAGALMFYLARKTF